MSRVVHFSQQLEINRQKLEENKEKPLYYSLNKRMTTIKRNKGSLPEGPSFTSWKEIWTTDYLNTGWAGALSSGSAAVVEDVAIDPSA